MRRKTIAAMLVATGGILACATVALPHFQVLAPSRDIVSAADSRDVDFSILFTHPMRRGPVMEMGAPREFGVLLGGKKTNLLDSLQARKLQGRTAYSCSYRIRRPGDHVFYLAPAPYWEPAERKMIVHYTKVVVDGLGAGEGWDALVGLPVEIEPLARPYGLWTNNVFRGIVRKNGKPVPFAEIEVEYYNKDGAATIPADPFETQVIKADANGTFCYAMCRAGWWGFAALVDGEPTKNPAGEIVDTELGGLIWVQATDMK